MYSILILDDKTKEWKFYQNEASEKWTGSLAEVTTQYATLLKTYPSIYLTVVHNTSIDFSGLAITDVTE
jgi:hypothetical protein